MKKITVAVCLDDEGGMMFNKRRQSRDRVLIRDFISSAVGKIHIHPYSEKQFLDFENVTASIDPISAANDGEYVFIENLPIKDRLNEIERIIIYKWNRLYPADTYFDVDPEACGFKLKSLSEFEGSSHEKITKGIYEK